MIIYISSDKGNILQKSNWVIKRYDRWKCDIRKFIKEEYVNISNSNCEMIVVDVYAMERAEEVLRLKEAFRKSIIAMLIPDDYRGTYPEGVDIIIKDKKTDEKLTKLLNPESVEQNDVIKVGVWSNNDVLSLQFAISLLSFFYNKADNVCLVEISDEFILGKNLKQYKLKDKEGIKYRKIPIVHNAMPEYCRLGIFTFIKKGSKRFFNKCDVPIEVVSKECIKVGNRYYDVCYSSRSYYKRNNTVFGKIFEKYITEQKGRKKEKVFQIIKKQGRKIFFAASIVIAIFIFSIVLHAMKSGRSNTYVNETTLERATQEVTVTEKVIVLEETTSAGETTMPEKTTIQEVTNVENATENKKNKTIKKIPETQSVIPKQPKIKKNNKLKEKVTKKAVNNPPSNQSNTKQKSKEKIVGDSSNREKIENYDANPNKEKIE